MQDRAKLRAIVAYCQSAQCRSRYILQYFGEPVEEDWECGNCDMCDRSFVACPTSSIESGTALL